MAGFFVINCPFATIQAKHFRTSSKVWSFDKVVELIMDFPLKGSDITEYHSDIITASHSKNFAIILRKFRLVYNKSLKKVYWLVIRWVKFSINIAHRFLERNFFELPEMSDPCISDKLDDLLTLWWHRSSELSISLFLIFNIYTNKVASLSVFFNFPDQEFWMKKFFFKKNLILTSLSIAFSVTQTSNRNYINISLTGSLIF